jgi:iron complex transport system substrate-binding protein
MKKKMVVLIGIAVCAMLLTSPVLASAGYSKIYGNANEDDVLDMRDVTYIKLVIFGKKPATSFADANYDGKISMLDIGQTKLIILGKEKQLTLVDMADRAVTVPRPIERIVSTTMDAGRITIAFGDCNKLVGQVYSGPVEDYKPNFKCGCGEEAKACGSLLEIPYVGRPWEAVNAELILSLKPDVVFASGGKHTVFADTVQEKTGIPVVCAGSGPTFEYIYKEIEIIGKVLEKGKEAENLISFMEEKIDSVRKITSEIPDSEKPKVYLSTRAHVTGMGSFLRSLTRYEPLDIAGGINVAKDCASVGTGYTVDVSKEQIIAWNPDIILVTRHSLKQEPVVPVEAVLSDPDLQTVNAVKNHKVYYVINMYCAGTPQHKNLVNVMYLSKLFYPDKFEDLDLEKEGNEIYKAFLGVDGLFTEFADWTVWLREYLETQ